MKTQSLCPSVASICMQECFHNLVLNSYFLWCKMDFPLRYPSSLALAVIPCKKPDLVLVLLDPVLLVT